jgi:hypothetical protein
VLNVEGLHPTAQGIEFRLIGKDPTGCNADLHFSAVLMI